MMNSKLILAALGDPVTDMEMIRCAFETFEVQSDLKDSCWEWDRQVAAPTWVRLMTHFKIEIQKNKTNLAKMKRQDKANAVLQQVKQQQEQ